MRHQRVSNKDYYTAITLGLLSAFFLSVASALGKYLITLSSLHVILFIRFFVPFSIICIPYYLYCKKHGTCQFLWMPYGLRAISVLIAQYCFFFLLSQSGLLLAILLYSTNGLFAPFLARIFLKHEIKKKTLLAIMVGIVGTAITLGPIPHATWFNISIGLLSGFTGACSQLALHQVSKTRHPTEINFYSYGLPSLLSFVLLIVTLPFSTPIYLRFLAHWQNILILLLFAVFSLGNQISRSLAYLRLNKAASLMPFLYCVLIFSAVIDWLWLGIAPSSHTYMGIGVIMFSGVIMAIRLRAPAAGERNS